MMMSCRAASRLLSEAQDRPLTRRERWALRLHVLLCRGCRRFGAQLADLRLIARTYVAGPGPDPTDRPEAGP